MEEITTGKHSHPVVEGERMSCLHSCLVFVDWVEEVRRMNLYLYCPLLVVGSLIGLRVNFPEFLLRIGKEVMLPMDLV